MAHEFIVRKGLIATSGSISGSSESTGSFGTVELLEHSFDSNLKRLSIKTKDGKEIASIKSYTDDNPGGVSIGNESDAGPQAVAIATGSKATGEKSVVIGANAETKAAAEGGIAIGEGSRVFGPYSTVIGGGIVSGSNPSSSVVIGTLSTGSADYTVAIGYNVLSANTSSIGIGKNVENYSLEGAVIGAESKVPYGKYSTAFGPNIYVSASYAVAIGHTAHVDGNAITLGRGIAIGAEASHLMPDHIMDLRL